MIPHPLYWDLCIAHLYFQHQENREISCTCTTLQHRVWCSFLKPVYFLAKFCPIWGILSQIYALVGVLFWAWIMWWCTKIDKCEVWYEQLQLTRIMFTFHFVFKMNALFLSSWWTGHHAQAHWPCNSVTQSQKYTKTNMIAVLVAPRAQWPGDPLKVVQGRSDPAHSLIWLLCTPPSSLSSYNHLDLLSRVQHAAL